MQSSSLVLSLLATITAATATAQQAAPLATSPGSDARTVGIEDACPTFRWTPVDGAERYELAVFAMEGAGSVSPDAMRPSMRASAPGSASSWTPSPDHCLRPGSFAWSVRAYVRGGPTHWSQLRRFSVSAPRVRLGEIIVTAQNRSENIRDVPISITAVTSDQLEVAGVTNNLELGAVVPGLKMDRVGGSTVPAIRGVSSYLTTVGTDANVAMYIDDIYVPSMQAATLDLSDISRIEVVKGPQGTLFGRNATGGAIRIFTRDPRLTSAGGEISASYGNFDDRVVNGHVSGPLIPGKLAVGLTGYDETGESYYHNLTPDVPLQNVHNYSVRAKVLFAPRNDTWFRLGAYTGQHNDPAAILYFPLDGITIARGVAGAVIPARPYDVATNVPVFETVTASGLNLRLNRTTAVGELSVLGAWSLAKSHGPVPLVAAAYPAPFTGFQSDVNDRSRAVTGEVNFASRPFGRLSFIAGANYYDKDDRWDPLEVEQKIPGNEFAVSIFAGQTTRAYASYGEATWQLAPGLSVIGGLRYSSETRGATGSVVAGIQPAGNYYDWGSRTFGDVTQRLSVRYHASPNTNVYVTYSTGFKSGNIVATSIPFGVTPAECGAANAATPGSCAFPPVLRPERIHALEAGIKSAPASRLHLDAALFAYRLADMQIQSYTNVCLQEPCPPNPRVQLSGYSNAASARMYGAELSGSSQATHALHLDAGLSLLDARFASYENASWSVPAPNGVGMVQAPTTSADGKRLPRAPRASVNLSGTYTRDLPPGTFAFTAAGYASDRMYYDVGNVFSQPGYATLALRGSFSPARIPNLSATVWGNNVTGTRVIAGTILGDSGANASFAPPATYGVTVRYRFD